MYKVKHLIFISKILNGNFNEKLITLKPSERVGILPGPTRKM